MSQYPSIDELEEITKENPDKNSKLFETRKSVRSILSQLFMFFIAAGIVIAINMFFPDSSLLGYFTTKYHISMRWLGIFPTLFFLETLRRYHDDLYSFTPHNLTHYDGRFSLNYSVPNIRYVDIRAVIVYQDLFGRLLDYGDIEVDTAAQERTEMYIAGVRSPQELADLIEALRETSRRNSMRNHPEDQDVSSE